MWKRGGGEEGVDETQEGVEGIKIAEGGQKWKQYAGGEGIGNKREGWWDKDGGGWGGRKRQMEAK